jgi:mRNA interferase MazF
VVPLAAGLVVLVRFPFSDLSQTKLRPAVVLADAGRGDWILCQVTSKPYTDSAAVVLEAADFQRGSLQVRSYARPGKLFTASGDLVESVPGVLQPGSLRGVIAAVVTILGGSD